MWNIWCHPLCDTSWNFREVPDGKTGSDWHAHSNLRLLLRVLTPNEKQSSLCQSTVQICTVHLLRKVLASRLFTQTLLVSGSLSEVLLWQLSSEPVQRPDAEWKKIWKNAIHCDQSLRLFLLENMSCTAISIKTFKLCETKGCQVTIKQTKQQKIPEIRTFSQRSAVVQHHVPTLTTQIVFEASWQTGLWTVLCSTLQAQRVKHPNHKLTD